VRACICPPLVSFFSRPPGTEFKGREYPLEIDRPLLLVLSLPFYPRPPSKPCCSCFPASPRFFSAPSRSSCSHSPLPQMPQSCPFYAFSTSFPFCFLLLVAFQRYLSPLIGELFFRVSLIFHPFVPDLSSRSFSRGARFRSFGPDFFPTCSPKFFYGWKTSAPPGERLQLGPLSLFSRFLPIGFPPETFPLLPPLTNESKSLFPRYWPLCRVARFFPFFFFLMEALQCRPLGQIFS